MDLPASSALRASELAVANLDGELLANMSYRLSSKDSLTSGEKLSPEQENRQAEVLEMLGQRSQMLKDGKLLTNFVQTDNEARFLSLWNDPSTRPYFAIKDEWLKLDQAELDSLGKVANTKLEKGDIKLVLSRILFQKGLEVNEANVAVALGELRSLRDKFGSLCRDTRISLLSLRWLVCLL